MYKLALALALLLLLAAGGCTGLFNPDDAEDLATFEALYEAAKKEIDKPTPDVAMAEEALDFAQANRMPLEEGKAYHLLGYLYRSAGEHSQAYRAYWRAVDKYRVAGHDSLRLMVTLNLGGMRIDGGLYEQALPLYNKVLTETRQGQYTTLTQNALRDLMIVHNKLGNFGESTKLFAQLEAAGANETLKSDALLSLGNAQKAKGLLNSAEETYKNGLAITHADSPNVATYMNNLGLLYLSMGFLDEAKVNFEGAYAQPNYHNNRRLQTAVNLARFVYLTEHDNAKALNIIMETTPLVEQPGRIHYKSLLLELGIGLAQDGGNVEVQAQLAKLLTTHCSSAQVMKEVQTEELATTNIRAAHEAALIEEKAAAEQRLTRSRLINALMIGLILTIMGGMFINHQRSRLRKQVAVLTEKSKALARKDLELEQQQAELNSTRQRLNKRNEVLSRIAEITRKVESDFPDGFLKK